MRKRIKISIKSLAELISDDEVEAMVDTDFNSVELLLSQEQMDNVMREVIE